MKGQNSPGFLSEPCGLGKEKTFFLHAGMLYCSLEPTVVTTLLGSCVSICLWDPYLRLGGINHFLVPYWNGEGLATPRYGDVAVEKLIGKMLSLGSKKSSLVAKVFGGSSLIMHNTLLTNVGERNVSLAQEILKSEGIHVAGADVGGMVGRKILFYTCTGTVMLKKLRPLYHAHPRHCGDVPETR
jgi:chemotaxis protein CheD